MAEDSGIVTNVVSPRGTVRPMERPADQSAQAARTRLPGVTGPAFDGIDAGISDEEARRTAALLLLLDGGRPDAAPTAR